MGKATYCVGVNEIGINSYVEHEIPETYVDKSTALEPDVDINESYNETEEELKDNIDIK